MPPQPRNTLSVEPIPGIDTIRVNLIDEHRFESRLYLSLEQAETLRDRLEFLLKPLKWHGPMGRFVQMYDVHGELRTFLVTGLGMFDVDGGHDDFKG